MSAHRYSILFPYVFFTGIFCIVLTNEIDGGWDTKDFKPLAEPGPCNIDVIDVRKVSFTQKHFLERYAFREPVIIKGATDNTNFQNLCIKENILQQHKDKIIKLSSANSYSYTKKDVTLEEYITKIMKPQTLKMLGNETFYWFGDNNYTEWQELFDQYIPPPYSLPKMTGVYSFGLAVLKTLVRSRMKEVADNKLVFIGGSMRDLNNDLLARFTLPCILSAAGFEFPFMIWAGTGVPFHFHGPGFGEVIFGRKRWFLYPHEKQPSFNPDKTTLHWLLEEYNNLHPADKPWECTINQGEVIYFPDRWWHGTLNIDTSVFISTFLG